MILAILSAFRPTEETETPSRAAMPHWRSAMRLRQAAPPSASSIHTLRARKPNHVIGNVAAYIDVVLPSLGARSILFPRACRTSARVPFATPVFLIYVNRRRCSVRMSCGPSLATRSVSTCGSSGRSAGCALSSECCKSAVPHEARTPIRTPRRQAAYLINRQAARPRRLLTRRC